MKKIILGCFLVLSCYSYADVRSEYKQDLKIVDQKAAAAIDQYSSISSMYKSADIEYKELDKLLTKYYQRLMGMLNKDQQIKLRDSQRAWLKFREKQYQYYDCQYSTRGGRMWGPLGEQDKNYIMRDRLNELVRMIENQQN